MDKTNSKIITVSFAVFAGLVGLSLSVLLRAFSGAFSLIARFTDADAIRHGLPVLVGLAVFLSLQFNGKVLAWADEVVAEIKKITWASKKDTYAMTIVVLVMVALSGVIISVFDFISAYLLNTFVR